jgi:hypothetical protein
MQEAAEKPKINKLLAQWSTGCITVGNSFPVHLFLLECPPTDFFISCLTPSGSQAFQRMWTHLMAQDTPTSLLTLAWL